MTKNLNKILNEYSTAVENLLGEDLLGIYLTGSIALNAYHENKSDIDFTTLIKNQLDEKQIFELSIIHKDIFKKYPKNAFEGHYITPEELGKNPTQINPVVSYYNGKINKSYHGINIVTWVTLKKHGVNIRGLPVKDLLFETSENELLIYVINNINSYWKQWLTDSKKLFSYKGLYSLTGSAVEWVVLGISRMYYTLLTNDITSKDSVVDYIIKKAPREYHRIILEAAFIRTKKGKKQYFSAFIRRKDMIAYLEKMIIECNELAKKLKII